MATNLLDKDSKTTDISKDWRIGSELGSGAFSVVKEAVNLKTGQKAAVKIINKIKHRRESELILAELQVLKRVRGNSKVVSLYEVYEDDSDIDLVLELVVGGELFDKIAEKGFYSEKDGSSIIRAVVQAVAFCHEHGVVHRDLKPENLLCGSKSFDDLTDLKLTDFGLSKVINGPTETISGTVGSPSYIAPEIVLNQNYRFEVDMWSVGVISYIILGGYAPFQNDNPRKPINRLICSAEFEFHQEEWAEVGEQARDFIRKLLVVDPKKRMTANDALNHPFIANDDMLSTKSMAKTSERFKNFNAKRRFKAGIWAVMTTNKISGLVSKLKAGVPAAASKDAAGASLPTATKEEAKVEPEPEVIEIPEDLTEGVSIKIEHRTAERPDTRSSVTEIKKMELRSTTNVDDLPRTVIPSSIHLNALEDPKALISNQRFSPQTRGDPRVSWRVATEVRGQQLVQIYYEAKDLYWNATYVAILNGASTKLQLIGNYNIVNNSGRSFIQPKIALTHHAKEFVLAEPIRELVDQQELRITFLEKQEFSVKPLRMLRLSPFGKVEESQLFVPLVANPHHSPSGHAQIVLQIEDADKDKYLLSNLPAGPVQVFQQRDGKKLQQFLNSSSLSHHGKGFEIVVGAEEKVKGQRIQTDFKIDREQGKVIEEVKVLVTNSSSKPQVVAVQETLYRWEGGKVVSSSHKYTDAEAAIVFEETVPATGHLDVTYVVEYPFKR